MVVFGISGAVVIASFALAGALGIEFLPSLDEGVIWVRANLPAGISLEKSADVAGKIRNIITQYPEVQLVSSQSGRNDSGTDPYGPNRNEFFLALKPYDTWPDGMNKQALVTQLSQKLNEQIPGAAFSFTQPIVDNVTESVTGSAADLAVILRGPDLGILRQTAQKILGVIRAVPGAADTAI
jgi:cobalt-zinc-cadmium resistance protein CzcA